MKRLMMWLFCLLPFMASAQNATKLSLNQAMQYALANSAEMKNALLAIEQSEQEVKSVISTGLPQLTASANFTHNVVIASQQLPDFISPAVYGVLVSEGLIGQDRFKSGSPQTLQFGAPSSMTGALNLSQLVFDGTYFLGLKAAKEYVLLSDLLKDYAQANLLENVQKSYYAVLAADHNVVLMNQSLVQINKTFEETNKMFSTGFAEQLDVDRLMLSKKTMENRVNNMSKQRDMLMQMLKFTIGMDISTAIELEGSLETYFNSIQTSPTATIKNRSEYQILKQQIILDSLNIKRYKVGYLPTLTLTGNYQRNSFATEAEFKGLGKTWNPGSYYGFNLSIPIFDGFYKQSKIAQARIQYETDRNKFEQTTNQLLFQSEQAQTNLEIANNNLETQKTTQSLAKSIYNTTLIKFNEGLTSSFELIQAENDKVSAEIEYSNALYQRLLAQIELEKTKGNLNPTK